MHTSHGDEVIGNELSGYYLAGNITRTYDGMMIALPQSEWEIFQTMPQHKLVELLLQLAVNVNLSLPKQLMLSGHHEASEDLSIMANIGWQNWSEFGEVGPSLGVPDATSLEVDANFEDTWHYALGARYRLNHQWSVSAGFAYDSSPVSNSNRTVAMPLDRQYRIGAGVQYQVRKNLTLGGAYEYMDAGDAPVNQSGGASVSSSATFLAGPAGTPASSNRRHSASPSHSAIRAANACVRASRFSMRGPLLLKRASAVDSGQPKISTSRRN